MRSAILEQIAGKRQLSVFCGQQNVLHLPTINSVLYSAAWPYTRCLFWNEGTGESRTVEVCDLQCTQLSETNSLHVKSI
jgi:hypothetical protein